MSAATAPTAAARRLGLRRLSIARTALRVAARDLDPIAHAEAREAALEALGAAERAYTALDCPGQRSMF